METVKCYIRKVEIKKSKMEQFLEVSVHLEVYKYTFHIYFDILEYWFSNFYVIFTFSCLWSTLFRWGEYYTLVYPSVFCISP